MTIVGDISIPTPVQAAIKPVQRHKSASRPLRTGQIVRLTVNGRQKSYKVKYVKVNRITYMKVTPARRRHNVAGLHAKPTAKMAATGNTKLIPHGSVVIPLKPGSDPSIGRVAMLPKLKRTVWDNMAHGSRLDLYVMPNDRKSIDLIENTVNARSGWVLCLVPV